MGNPIRPCTHPKCADSHGDPYVTSLGMCEPCQTRFERLLCRLVVDWVNLSANLPTPARTGSRERRTTQQVYGHPAEWASDAAAQIASVLNETHDALADLLGETPPPHPAIAERLRVRSAWNYLECRIPQLALADFGGDTAAEMRGTCTTRSAASSGSPGRGSSCRHRARHASYAPCSGRSTRKQVCAPLSEDTPILLSFHGTTIAPNTANENLRRVKDGTPLHWVTWGNLRDTVATHVAGRSGDPRRASAQLGHAQGATMAVKRYIDRRGYVHAVVDNSEYLEELDPRKVGAIVESPC
ncbi:hypothetical protein ACFROC_19350 [Nocardia tengchongensis]|uniref:hypothetical protein n=1 Tax=Nocardia tengchongensis TaxID=2055889 RepID=UPI0036B055CE